MRLAGYAALFGTRDGGRDLIWPGAFARTLASRADPLPLLWQHRPDQRIGWVDRIAEDRRGLRVVATIDNPQGGAAMALPGARSATISRLALKRGAVTGLSFGYRARAFTRSVAGRDLTAVDLFEVSLVTHPMQHAARVHLLA